MTLRIFAAMLNQISVILRMENGIDENETTPKPEGVTGKAGMVLAKQLCRRGHGRR